MLNNLIKEVTFKSVVLEEPDVLKCTDESGDIQYYTLGKEALTSLYARFGIAFSTSKDLFNSNREVWEDFKINNLILKNNQSLASYRYVTLSDSVIIAFFDKDADDITCNYDIFDETYLHKPGVTLTINKGGVIQIVQEIKVPETNSMAVLFIDINPVKGLYTAYDGVRIDESYVVMATPIISSKSFYEFMVNFEPLTEMQMVLKFYPNMVRLFQDDELIDTKISLREAIDLIKRSKCEVTLDQHKKLVSFDLVGDTELVAFFNSFQMPWKSLVDQELLKNSLTYGNFTTLQMLKLLSQNYKQASNLIDASMLSGFTKSYMDQRTDRNIADECIPNISN